MASQTEGERTILAEIGQQLGPEVLAKVEALYRGNHAQAAADQPPVARDQSYGEHSRQVLDIYSPSGSDGDVRPILVWVHGGGFVRGDKAGPDGLFNAHVGRFVARNGFIGAVMNYRLAPDHGWPAGGEDIGSAVDWLKANAGQFGGDPSRIILAGTSAGAVHITTYLQLHPESQDVCGAILLSGLYGYTPLDERDRTYYGREDLYPGRMSKNAVLSAAFPVFVACAELDPGRFQTEMLSLTQDFVAQKGRMPRAYIVPGHNHYSLALHIGTSDTRVSDEILSFARDCCAGF